MARTPFKLRSGNTTPFKQMGSSPVKKEKKNLLEGIGNIFQSFGDFLSTRKTKEEVKESMDIGKSLQKKYKGSRGKKQTTDFSGKKIGTGETQQERMKSLQGSSEDSGVIDPPVEGTDYTKMKSVNALVKERTKWRANNPGVKFPGQEEINKRLAANPNKWD